MDYMTKLNAAGTAWIDNQWEVGKATAALPAQFPSANAANASCVATIPAIAGQTAYITGFDIYAGGATLSALVDAVVAGLLGGSRTFPFSTPAGATLSATPLSVRFPAPIFASAVNTAVTVTLAALGAGNTKTAVVALGGYV